LIIIAGMVHLIHRVSTRPTFEKGSIISGLAKCACLVGLKTSLNGAEVLERMKTWISAKNEKMPGNVWETVRHFNLMIRIIELLNDNNYVDSTLQKWVEKCANAHGGYGLWPGSQSRLSSTYYALEILEYFNTDYDVDKKKHADWITGCQSPVGWFVSSISNRPDWENTYFAVSALSLLDAIEQIKYKNALIESLRNLLGEGFHELDIRKVYCCGLSLHALGSLTLGDKQAIQDFIVRAIPRLQYAKIRYTAEKLAEVLELGKLVMEEQKLFKLFPDLETRLSQALKEELKPFMK